MKWRMNIYQALAMMEVQSEHMLYFGNWVVQTQRRRFSYCCHSAVTDKHNVKHRYIYQLHPCLRERYNRHVFLFSS